MSIRPLAECKVVTFLENNHYHPQTAEAMNNLLPFFKEQNFKVLCLESFRTNLADELIAQRKDNEHADLLSMLAIKEADRE
jgi:hypothetical protein